MYNLSQSILPGSDHLVSYQICDMHYDYEVVTLWLLRMMQVKFITKSLIKFHSILLKKSLNKLRMASNHQMTSVRYQVPGKKFHVASITWKLSIMKY